MDQKNRRHNAVVEMRRALVLEAVKAVAEKSGIEKASIREIAKQAGYTPGALYAYFATKDDMFGELLKQLLRNLELTIPLAKPARNYSDPLEWMAISWMSHWSQRPGDLKLLMYFLAGGGKGKLSPESENEIHRALRSTLDPVIQTLAESGVPFDALETERETILAYALGLLAIQNHNLLQPSQEAPQSRFYAYLKKLAQHFNAESHLDSSNAVPKSNSTQVDMFTP
jgi:AcrR family transcriptional regulator